MQQVKFFTGLEGATEELANELNSWIRETGAKIQQITGNIAPQSNPNGAGGQSHGLPGTGLSGSSMSRARSDLFVIVLYTID